MKFKRSPEDVIRFGDDVLALARILDRDDLEEINSWPIEDRGWMLVVWRAQQEEGKG